MLKTERRLAKYFGLVISHLFILAIILGCSSSQDTTSEPVVSDDVPEEEVVVEEEAEQEIVSDSPRRMSDDELRAFFEPIGPMPIPEDNPMTDEKIELGNTLFVDHRLSGNGMLSCLTCHSPGAGYSDGHPTSIGFEGVVLGRNSPTIINSGYFDELFWDGRAGSLEEQALGPIQDPNEMNQTLEGLVKVVESIEGYKTMFDAAFDGVISAENIAKALAAFQRTIFINDTKHDQFIAGDDDALTEVQKYGMEIYVTKASCIACHAGPNFTDNLYHSIGLTSDDKGRYNVTGNKNDIGKFRTMGLRGKADKDFYMHDGRFGSLEEVVDYYDRGGDKHGDTVSPHMRVLGLTSDEKEALVAYLHAISGDVPAMEIPKLPE